MMVSLKTKIYFYRSDNRLNKIVIIFYYKIYEFIINYLEQEELYFEPDVV